MLNMFFLIQKSNKFISLIWHCVTKADNFIVFTHLGQKIFSIRPENI